MTGLWRPLYGGRGLELVALWQDTNRPTRGILARLVGYWRRRQAKGVTRAELCEVLEPDLEPWPDWRVLREVAPDMDLEESRSFLTYWRTRNTKTQSRKSYP